MLIRKVFSLFALVMLGLIISRIYAGVWTELNWLMLAVSLVVCVLVFTCFVFIFNFSYSLACVINGSLIFIFYPSAASLLLAGAMVLYGFRLGIFSLARVRSDSYAPRAANTRAADEQMPVFVKGALWLQCGMLYTFHLFAVYLVARQGRLTDSVIAAFIIIAIGLVIEALADSQKQKAKNQAAGNYVSNGLFARWRHPNYVGEIIVQIGLIVAGVGAVTTGWANYLAVSIAPVYIILLMLSECRRADETMLKHYDGAEGFAEYWQRSGSMLPKFGSLSNDKN